MNLRAAYKIYERPVRFEQVIEGLWVAQTESAETQAEDDYFRSVSLFQQPMLKPRASEQSAPTDLPNVHGGQ